MNLLNTAANVFVKADSMGEPKTNTGKVSWRCPSNIALIKYWGKHGEQLPNNPSLSITLQNAYTETTIAYEYQERANAVTVEFDFGQKKNEAFEERVVKFIHKIQPQMPFMKHLHLKIESKNNFPHSVGIASSASAFGSLALCLCSIEETLFEQINGFLDFRQKASYLARIGSGSACRSIYPGYVIWGLVGDIAESSDIHAMPFNQTIHPVFANMQDSILLVSSEKKKVSSSLGHQLMEANPYSKTRYKQATEHLLLLTSALEKGDLEMFIKITEAEALSLHALMMLSDPAFVLIKPNSLAIIERIQQFRNNEKIPVCFTMDAGPNIHLLYPEEYKEEVQTFIKDELLPFCEHGQWIHDKAGSGPEKMEDLNSQS